MKPIKLDLIQGSKEWLTYRKCHLMASDTAKIVGKSPYGTPLDCYNEKVNNETQYVTPAMKRGLALEGRCREWIAIKYDQILEPAVYQHGEISYMGASLDACTDDAKHIHEIKNPMTKGFNAVKAQNKPNELDIWQCQKHLEVMNLQKTHIHYFNVENDEIQECLTFEILRSEEQNSTLKEHEKIFWKMVVNLTPPPLRQEDYQDIEDEEFFSLEREYEEVCDRIKHDDARKSEIKARMVDIAGERRSKGKLTKIAPVAGVKTDWKMVALELKASEKIIKKHTVDKKVSWYVYKLKRK